MTRRAAAAIAALLLAVLAACGSGGGSADAVRGSIAEEPTTTGAPSTTTTAAAGATTSTTRRTTTTTTARSATTTSTAAGTPGAAATALTPPAPGTYRYNTSGTTTYGVASQPFPAVTTLVVDPPTGTLQHSARNLQDPSGAGPLTEFTLDYRPQGVFLVALRITIGAAGTSQTLDLRPASPVLLLATGAGPGTHTEADLPGATGAKLVVDVLGAERLTVAGQAVDTVVMRAVVTLAPGDVTGTQSLTVNVDRTSRLWVRERSVLDASAAAGLFKLHSEYTANIQRLTP